MKHFCGSVFFVFAYAVTLSFAQTIPDDPNSLPTKIGGDPIGNLRAGPKGSTGTDSITVSGKITLDGFPADQQRPVVYVSVYVNGRLASRKQATERGSYTINDVPRGEYTIIVEIEHDEVASRQLNYTPSSMVYQDFTVSWNKSVGLKTKPGVLSAIYVRSTANQGRFDRAVTEIGKGNNDQAISVLKELVANDPNDVAAWTQLANAYFLKKDSRNAETAYLRALSEAPAYTRALVNLGKLYLSENTNDKAIEILTRAVDADPSSADTQHYLGEAYLAIKKGSKAVSYLNEAIRLAPIEKAEVHLRLASLYNAAGLKPKASIEYQKFLEKVPKYEHRDQLKKYIAENPPVQ